MATPQAYLVVSHVPIVINDAGQVTSYLPGQLFVADPNLPDVLRLLGLNQIVPAPPGLSEGADNTPTLLIPDNQLEVAYIKAGGTRPWTGNQSLGGNKLTNAATPTASGDVANKAYVDAALGAAGDYTIVAHTADASLTLADANKLHTNEGAGVDIALTLPAFAAGKRFFFSVTDAFYLRVNNLNVSTTLSLGTATGAAGGYLRSNVPGSALEVYGAANNKWFTRVTGDWTRDA